MKVVTTYYAPSFRKSVKKYITYKNKIEKTINCFQNNPFHPSLKTHKLAGKLENCWSFSVDYHLRIVFEFIDESTVGFINIGTHEIYK